MRYPDSGDSSVLAPKKNIFYFFSLKSLISNAVKYIAPDSNKKLYNLLDIYPYYDIILETKVDPDGKWFNLQRANLRKRPFAGRFGWGVYFKTPIRKTGAQSQKPKSLEEI